MALRFLPCIDSTELAAANREALDIDRKEAARLGKTAVKTAREGFYLGPKNRRVDWLNSIEAARQKKISIPPEKRLPAANKPSYPETTVEVANYTTLVAAEKLHQQKLNPVALNFANSITPGGGFTNGSRAQEEVLCRSSSLYQTLVDDPMYREHRKTNLQKRAIGPSTLLRPQYFELIAGPTSPNHGYYHL